MKQIQQSQENDKILSEMLALEVKKARDRKSLSRLCSELNIEVLA